MSNDGDIDEIIGDGEFGRDVASEAKSYRSKSIDTFPGSESGTELRSRN